MPFVYCFLFSKSKLFSPSPNIRFHFADKLPNIRFDFHPESSAQLCSLVIHTNISIYRHRKKKNTNSANICVYFVFESVWNEPEGKTTKIKTFFSFSNYFTQCQPLVWSEWLFFAWHFPLSHVEGEVLMNCIRNNNIFVWNCSFTSGKMSSNWPIFAHGDSCVCFEFKKFSQLMLNFSNRRNLSITKANHYQTNI